MVLKLGIGSECYKAMFENDVEMYGAQTGSLKSSCVSVFENDVEMYGAQTNHSAGN